MGFNPFFHTTREMVDVLKDHAEMQEIADEVHHVKYFGAGCSSEKRKSIVHTAMQLTFRNADILVEHDMLGAALATCQGQPGIACILGTGSNAAYYDGEKLQDDVHALGYILGDEGSGSYLGKKLLADFLYEKLPLQMNTKLQQEYDLDKEVIFENVYHKPHPNVYLASFARFLSDNKDNYYIRRLVKQGLLEFLDIHVCRFDNYREVPVHFVGSIAYFFEDILRENCERRQIQMGKLMKQPVEGLVDYYLNVAKV
jgi:N-acetylglucosamine kinase-like BadF-type ATPase